MVGSPHPQRTIVLDAAELAIVRESLARHIPNHRVWAFGSRATGQQVKRFSDLDLAVEGEITWRERADLQEELDESDLSIKVDVLELNLVDPHFRALIEPHFVLLQEPLPSVGSYEV